MVSGDTGSMASAALASTARAALIIPALNEEPVLGRTLCAIPEGLFEVVIVADNGSTDRTAEVARAGGAMVVSEPERGYGAACLKALAALSAGIDVVVFMQADMSEDPAEARRLIEPIARGEADLRWARARWAGPKRAPCCPIRSSATGWRPFSSGCSTLIGIAISGASARSAARRWNGWGCRSAITAGPSRCRCARWRKACAWRSCQSPIGVAPPV